MPIFPLSREAERPYQQVENIRKRTDNNNNDDQQNNESGDGPPFYISHQIEMQGVKDNGKNNGPGYGRKKGTHYLIGKEAQGED
jgi:hypothetical protein